MAPDKKEDADDDEGHADDGDDHREQDMVGRGCGRFFQIFSVKFSFKYFESFIDVNGRLLS